MHQAVLYFVVTTMGFEPTRPFEHQPLKLASLPVSPRRRNKKSQVFCPTFVT